MLYLIRGLPGSGKSTYAKSLNCLVLEADMYSMRNGKYDYDHSRIADAHAWCLEQAQRAIDLGIDVAVANTFCQFKFLIPYITYAQDHNCPVYIKEMFGNYGNIHNVPEIVLKRMKDSWEPLPDNFLIQKRS